MPAIVRPSQKAASAMTNRLLGTPSAINHRVINFEPDTPVSPEPEPEPVIDENAERHKSILNDLNVPFVEGVDSI